MNPTTRLALVALLVGSIESAPALAAIDCVMGMDCYCSETLAECDSSLDCPKVCYYEGSKINQCSVVEECAQICVGGSAAGDLCDNLQLDPDCTGWCDYSGQQTGCRTGRSASEPATRARSTRGARPVQPS